MRFARHSNTVHACAFSPDGTLAASTGGDNNETFLWRTADAQPLHCLVGKGRGNYGAAWTVDGMAIAWGNSRKGSSITAPLEHTFLLLDLERSELSDDKDLRRAQPARGSLVLEVSGNTSLAVKEGEAIVSTFTMKTPYERIGCFTLLPGERAAVGTSFGLYLIDARSGKTIRSFQDHTGNVWGVAPSPDGRFLLSASDDQTLRIWDPDRIEPVLSLFFAGDDWIAWTPAGYYAASPGGEQLMGWHVNNGLAAMASYYPASRFRKTLHRPDVIKRLLESGSVDRALADANTAAGRRSAQTEVAEILPPRVTITAPGTSKAQVQSKSLNVEAAARNVGANPVTGMRLLLDDRPVPDGIKTFPSPVLGEVRARWTIEIPPGNHRLTVQASSAVSKGLSEPLDVVGAGDDSKATGRLYLLVVGINDYLYLGNRFKLDSAAPDARSIHKAFQDFSRPLFRSVEARVLLDRQATRANILEALHWLKQNARAGDKAVVFYAGHGDNQITGQFYILPVDAKLDDLRTTGISDDDLKKSIGELPCSTVLMLDACYSGSFGQKKRKTRSLAKPTDALAGAMVNDYGLAILCGARDNQEAIEEGGHGFFTQALTQGMSGAADSDKDGVVELYELLPFVKSRVSKLSSGDQVPTVGIPPSVESFALTRP